LLSFPAHSDIVLGDSDAPVTIVEYGSITCGYCVRFHREILPLIKSFYIETGMVRFIYRDYPTTYAALRGAIAAHCAGPDSYYMFLNAVYNSVEKWSQANDVDNALIDIATSQGLEQEAFRKCLNEPEQAQSVNNERDEGVLQYDISGTPTFLVNGNVVRGFQTFEEIEMLIEIATSQSD
jgi:protein-disulfide isomerase